MLIENMLASTRDMLCDAAVATVFMVPRWGIEKHLEKQMSVLKIVSHLRQAVVRDLRDQD